MIRVDRAALQHLWKQARQDVLVWRLPEVGVDYIEVPKVATRSVRFAVTAGALGVPVSEVDARRVRDEEARRAERITLARLVRQRERPLFVVVRDPFERARSMYLDKLLGTGEARGLKHYGLDGATDLEDFARRIARIPDRIASRHFRSQHRFTHHRRRPVADHLLRLEHLREGWAELQAVYEALPDLPHRNRSDRDGPPERAAYTPAAAALVRRRYREDFATFGYPSDAPSG